MMSPMTRALFGPLMLGLILAAVPVHGGIPYPGVPPGNPKVTSRRGQVFIQNRALSVEWEAGKEGLRLKQVVDVQGRRNIALVGSLFEIVLTNSNRYSSTGMVSEGEPALAALAPAPSSPRLAGRIPGRVIELPMHSRDGLLEVSWHVEVRRGANYIRQELEIRPTEDCVIQEVRWLGEPIPGAKTLGAVDGSPVVAGNFFLSPEDPHASNSTVQSVLCRVPRNAMLKRGETLRQSFVIGVAPRGQLRRGFLYYLERERAHPYRPYLHYNSWYDTAWAPFALNETNCLEAIRLLGERLIKPFGVAMDGMVFDDGWDDPKTLWQFHQGFPTGFAPLADLCRQYHTRLGVWLSPFGGYGKPRQERLKFGGGAGFETNAAGFSLAGPKYYAAFKRACVDMIRKYGVNHFKFDGIAAGTYAAGGGQYLLDTEAMCRLMLDLRREEPDLFINLTTGSWPSPFWLRYADSVWRQGGDMGLAGKGSKQQQWLTYRDQETYQNIVRKGPLYPLNSLMTQGVAYSRQGMAGDPTFNSAGFKDDVRAFFGSGTDLQELYIQPGKLTAADWSVLAEAGKWSRANANVLVDTHWIGGDPGKLEVSGYASWSPRKGIISLRNPGDRPQRFSLDIGQAFELPRKARRTYRLKSPLVEDAFQPPIRAKAGRPVTLELKPFEVLILETISTKARSPKDLSE